MRRWLVILGLACSLAVASTAATATILNGSFELADIPANSVARSEGSGQPNIQGWNLAGSPDLADSPLAQDGSQYLFLFGRGSFAYAPEGVDQVVATAIGQAYTLEFYVRGGSQSSWIGGNFGSGFSETWLDSSAGGGFDWTANSSNLTLAVSINDQVALSVVAPSTSQWTKFTLNFDGTGSDKISFENLGDPGASADFTALSLDNVSLLLAPEPSTALLVSLGLLALGAGLRQRRA
jgi:hypothetical protein